MTSILRSSEFQTLSRDAVSLIFEFGVKGSVILFLSFLFALAVRKHSASARYKVWMFTVFALVLAPIASLSLPVIPVLPGRSNEDISTSDFVSTSRVVQSAAAGEETPVRFSSIPAQSPVPVIKDTQAASQVPIQPKAQPVDPTLWVLLLWMLGAFVTLLPSAVGHLVIRRAARGAIELDDAETSALMDPIAARRRLKRTVGLLLCETCKSPLVFGILRPTIMVPPAWQDWSNTRRRAVLLHEMAHVHRRDLLVQAVTRLACALYWFNPLVWLAARRLRVEREMACEDLVLVAGIQPSDYATELLRIAREMRERPWSASAALPMARSLRLERRLASILDSARDRRSISKRGFVFSLLLAAVLVSFVGSIGFSQQSEVAKEEDERYRPIERHADETAGTSTITGIVVDESDFSLADMDVRAIRVWLKGEKTQRERVFYERATGWGEESAKAIVRTDASGGFALENLAEGMWVIWVDDVRFARDWPLTRHIKIPADANDFPLRIKLYSPQSLCGVVRNEAGQTVRDAEVTLITERPNWSDRPLQGHSSMDLQIAKTDASGRFALERLHPGGLG